MSEPYNGIDVSPGAMNSVADKRTGASMLQSVEEGMALILGAVCGTDIITGRETHFI